MTKTPIKTVDFIFDFASPNAYFAHKALEGVVERTGAQINYIPCLLGGIFRSTGNQAPMITYANIKGKNDYEMLEIRRFIMKHGLVKFRMNSAFPINSLMLIRSAIACEQDGRMMEFIDAGLRLLWEDDKKLDDPVVFVEEITKAGFDGAKLLERTQDPEVKAKLMANTQAAVERGAFGIPTFYVGDEMFFGKDRLGQLEEEILR
jgi:2-hydroxychromene-2-carboxylate isomerase